MGSSKKHKSKKHRTSGGGSSSFEERDINRVTMYLRVPQEEDEEEENDDEGLLVQYPLEDIARARMGLTDSRPHHKRSKKSKKKHKHVHALSPAPVAPSTDDLLKATGLDDISDEDVDEIRKEVWPLPAYRGPNPGKKFPHAKPDPSPQSLRVEIDLGKLSLGKRTLPGKRHSSTSSGQDTKISTSYQTTPSPFKQVPPTSKQTPPVFEHGVSTSSFSERKKKKKKHKHRHSKQHEAPPTLPSFKEEIPMEEGEEEDDWIKPTSSPQLSFEDSFSSSKSFNDTSSLIRRDETSTHQLAPVIAPVIPPPAEEEVLNKVPALSSPASSTTSSSHVVGTRLPPNALKYFLRHLHNQLCRNDPEGVFSEPVTDEIAPGYSAIIKQPMDLQTMGHKVELNEYPSVSEFKDDFIIMCSNAMTYNSPETVYYQTAKRLLSVGLKMIQKELSIRPDIQHGLIPLSQSLPLSSSSSSVDYSSPYLCRINLSMLPSPAHSVVGGVGGVASDDINNPGIIDVAGEVMEPVVDQSHLTCVQVGFDTEPSPPPPPPPPPPPTAPVLPSKVIPMTPKLKQGPVTRTSRVAQAQSTPLSPVAPVTPSLTPLLYPAPIKLHTLMVDTVEGGEGEGEREVVSEGRGGGGEGGVAVVGEGVSSLKEEDVLAQVDEATKNLREEHSSSSPAELSFLNQDEEGETYLNILNPHTVSSRLPVDLTSLSEKIKAGHSASTVLTSELPVFKATPVSYLMYGPFGSFAPTYDTAFATLTKNDSSLLLSTYGSEKGVSYANSLQQFVKGCGSFALEMGNAILNSLTSGRHGKLQENTLKQKEETEKVASKSPTEIEDSKENVKEKERNDDNNPNASQEDQPMETESEVSPGIPEVHSGGIQDTIDSTSKLIGNLSDIQRERLSKEPVLDDRGHYVLPSPSEQELKTVSTLTSQLVSVASKVKPSDLVSTPTLHEAMGTAQSNSSLSMNTVITSSSQTH